MVKAPKISKSQFILLLSFIILFCAELAFFVLKLKDNPQLLVCLFSVFAIGIVIILAIFCLLKITTLKIETIFLICLIIVGIGYITVIGPLKSNDETSHYITTYWLSNLFFGQDMSSVQMRADDIEFYKKWAAVTLGHKDQFSQLQDGFSWVVENPDLTPFIGSINRTPLNTPIQMYLFPSLGFSLGRLLGLGPVPTYYLGRLFALIAFSVIAYIAVRNTPIGKPVFMTVSLLPLTVELSSSLSYDGPTIAIAMLLCSFCFKAIYAEKQQLSTLAAIAIASVLLVPMKVVYSTIVLLALLIPTKSFPSKSISILYKSLLLLGCLFVFMVTQLGSALSIMTSDTSNYSVKDSYEAYSVYDLVEQPAWAGYVFLNSFFERLDFKVFTYLGAYMGQVNLTPVGGYTVSLAFFVILLFAFVSEDSVAKPKWTLPALCVLCFLLSSAALEFTMFVGNAERGAEVLIGVLGRYFIPITPLLIPLFTGTRLTRNYPTPKILLFGTLCLNAFYVIDIFGFIALAQQ